MSKIKILNEKFVQLVQPILDESNSKIIKMEKLAANYIDPRILENPTDYFVKLSPLSVTSLKNLKSFRLPENRSQYIAQLEFTPSEIKLMLENDDVFKKNIVTLLSDCWDSFFSAGIKEFPYHKSCSTPGRDNECFMKSNESDNTIVRVYLTPAIKKENSNV